jgi:hypothetical protein
MTKFFLRLFVACTSFALSVGLTSFSKLLRGSDSSTQTVGLERPQSKLDFDQDEKQLLEIYRDYGSAQTRHDRAFFEKLETDDFILFLGEEHLSREEDIQQMEKSPTDIVYDSDLEYLKIFGDAAVVQGCMEARYSNGHVDSWSFIDIWVRRDHVWQIQSTTSIE